MSTQAEYADLLTLMTEDPRVDPDYRAFLKAVQFVASKFNGCISPNDVREELSNSYGLTIEPRLYSAFWFKASRKSGPIERTTWTEPSTDRRGRNTNKDCFIYRIREAS